MFVKLGKLACVKSSKVLTSQNKARTKKKKLLQMVETYFPAHCVRWKMALIQPFNVHTWKKEEKRKKVNSVARKYWSDNEFH